MSGADLFVVCKNCGSEVSPYITECPYCGTRLRKRAPKLEKARAQEEKRQRKAAKPPRLGRLRSGEIPGIAVDVRPWATIVLVLASVGASLAWQLGAFAFVDYAIVGDPAGEWWRVVTALFLYDNQGYLFAALVATGIFGWLLERRHGRWAPLLLFFAGGAAGMAVAAVVETSALAAGANGAALALLCAWALPDLLARRAGRETDGDLLGTAVIAAVLLLMPVAVTEADPIAGVVGAVVGFVLGLPLARRVAV